MSDRIVKESTSISAHQKVHTFYYYIFKLKSQNSLTNVISTLTTPKLWTVATFLHGVLRKLITLFTK